ncbi:hypothetical protein HU230_0012405 [Bradyrhizobium quebecense]|uniref:Uncharacterized protein n=1 Tax=Bradyrhizobium quebecense TaxID=2748629 RepID=A0A973WMS2_9BRAD|nr:hypothetical protein [Bradyrhizobium quebecense]UGA46790.1 hypothetical protein HU230_0012405 [Bradyrhizobium quebecense]
MAISDTLTPYKPQEFPQLPGSEQRYMTAELQRVSASLAAAIAVIKQMDAKQVSHGW